MKKVKDVFVLPVVPKGGIRVYVTALRDDADCAEAEQLAAHAINHADALADALGSIVTDYNQYRALNGIDLTDDHNAKLDAKMAAAEAALAAYRGEA